MVFLTETCMYMRLYENYANQSWIYKGNRMDRMKTHTHSQENSSYQFTLQGLHSSTMTYLHARESENPLSAQSTNLDGSLVTTEC